MCAICAAFDCGSPRPAVSVATAPEPTPARLVPTEPTSAAPQPAANAEPTALASACEPGVVESTGIVGPSVSSATLSSHVIAMQGAYRARDRRTLARMAGDQRASREERMYADYLLYRLGDRAALQGYVDEFPLHDEAMARLRLLGFKVSKTCKHLDCIDTQYMLACAAMEGVPRAREKILRYRALTDAGVTTDNDVCLGWLLLLAPVEMARLEACTRKSNALVEAIRYGGLGGLRPDAISEEIGRAHV